MISQDGGVSTEIECLGGRWLCDCAAFAKAKQSLRNKARFLSIHAVVQLNANIHVTVVRLGIGDTLSHSCAVYVFSGADDSPGNTRRVARGLVQIEGETKYGTILLFA